MPTSPTANRRLKIHRWALRLAVASLGLLSVLLFSSLVVSLIAQEAKREQAKKPAVELKSRKDHSMAPAVKEATPIPLVRVKNLQLAWRADLR